MHSGGNLIDLIYEAAFTPDLWEQVLEGLGCGIGAAGAALLVHEETRPVRFAACGPMREVAADFVAAGRWRETRRLDYFRQNPFTGFVMADDYFPKELLESEAAFENRARAGFGDQIGTMIPMPAGELVVVAFDRWAADGSYPADATAQLNAVYPHLSRAAMIAARLRLEQAQATTSALQAIGLPAAVLSRTRRVRAANPLFEALGSLFLPTAFGGMALCDPAANDLFRQAIEAANGTAVRSIPMKAAPGRPPMVVHVLPLIRSARDIFAGADLLVAATAARADAAAPSPSILTGLFDLSAAEARLAAALARGQSVKDFAAEAGISFATARKYLDRVYAKTGAHRQNELVALLRGAQPFG